MFLTPFRPAKRRPQLQWGHGREAVEDIGDVGRGRRLEMLQWGHGREAVEDPAAAARLMGVPVLQWGHGREAVEDAAGARVMTGMRGFNGATAVRPWKTGGSWSYIGTDAKLQWGHGR